MPEPQDVWSKIHGRLPLHNDIVRCLLVKEDMLLAGTAGGEVLTSVDDGQTWRWADTPPSDPCILSIIGVGPELLAGSRTGGIFASSDRGLTWCLIARLDVTELVALTAIDNQIFAGTSRGVYRSTCGRTWKSVTTTPNISVSALTSIGAMLFAASGEHFLASEDYGLTWERRGYFDAPIRFIQESANILYVGLGNGHVFGSTNHGNAFVLLRNGKDKPTLEETLAILRTDKALLEGTSHSIHRSNDGGATWNRTHFNQVFCIAKRNSTIVAGTQGGGILRSTDDGETWEHANTHSRKNRVLTLLVNGGSLLAGLSDGRVIVSADDGNTWSTAPEQPHRNSVVSIAAKGTILVAGTYGGIQRSTDNGRSWHPTALFPDTAVRTLVASDTTIVAGIDGQGVHVSNDHGLTWLCAESQPSLRVQSIAVLGTTLFAGTLDDGLFSSRDGGLSWARVSSEAPRHIVALVACNNTLIASTLSGIHISHDNGIAWKASSERRCVHLFAVNASACFASTWDDNSMLRSLDAGATWTALSGPPCACDYLAASDTHLFVGEHGGSTWRRPLPWT